MSDRQERESEEHHGCRVIAGLKWHPQEEWTVLVGQTIEVHEHGRILDTGRVEEVTNDGHVLWLEMHGVKNRRLIEKSPDTEVKIL